MKTIVASLFSFAVVKFFPLMKLKNKFLCIFTLALLLLCYLFSPISSASADPSPVDLSGEWTVRGVTSTGDSRGCTRGGSCSANGSDCNEYKVTIIQSGNSISFEAQISYTGGGLTYSSRGSISGNEVRGTGSGGGFSASWQGTISEDGNTVTGTNTCSYVDGPATDTSNFTWTREQDVYYLTL